MYIKKGNLTLFAILFAGIISPVFCIAVVPNFWISILELNVFCIGSGVLIVRKEIYRRTGEFAKMNMNPFSFPVMSPAMKQAFMIFAFLGGIVFLFSVRQSIFERETFWAAAYYCFLFFILTMLFREVVLKWRKAYPPGVVDNDVKTLNRDLLSIFIAAGITTALFLVVAPVSVLAVLSIHILGMSAGFFFVKESYPFQKISYIPIFYPWWGKFFFFTTVAGLSLMAICQDGFLKVASTAAMYFIVFIILLVVVEVILTENPRKQKFA